MAYESFYGGRQGASFVIVKNYPYIYPPEDPNVEDLSMVTEFKKGGASVDQVNYGEYVIIDTYSKNDPDNGKVFCRGMDYTDDLGGAKYIGQICGPDGKVKDVSITYYTNPDFIDPGVRKDQSGSGVQGPTEENPGLVPGYEDGTFKDEIKYRQTHLIDQYGNITQYLIGFEIPYLVQEFTGVATNPYETTNLIRRTDDKSHPFYQSQEVSVPKGIKGNTITKLERINTQTRDDVVYYEDTDCTIPAGITNAFLDLDIDHIDFTLPYLPIDINGETYYIYNGEDSTTTSILRYTEVNYDNSPEGETNYVNLSPYNIIRSISLNERGDIYVDYTYDNLVYIGRLELEKNTLGIVCRIDDEDLLTDDSGNDTPIPPEYMKVAQETREEGNIYIYTPGAGEDSRYIGQLVAIEKVLTTGDIETVLWAYDYILNKQYSLGGAGGGSSNPSSIVAFEPDSTAGPADLNIHGAQFVTNTRKSI